MSIRNGATRSALTLACTMLLLFSPASPAGKPSNDSTKVSALLADAKTEAGQLRLDTEEMESFTRSNLSWKTYASSITEIKGHVNNIGVVVGKLNDARGEASTWQQQAIDHINPLLSELAADVEATIDQLNEHQSLVHSSHYREYVQGTHEHATNLAALISDFVAYGQSKEKIENLGKESEVSER